MDPILYVLKNTVRKLIIVYYKVLNFFFGVKKGFLWNPLSAVLTDIWQKYLFFLHNNVYSAHVHVIALILFFILCRFLIKKYSYKIFRLPHHFFEKWERKSTYKFHVITNVYRYGGATNERKYDREAFGIEEQIFQQCVPVRALTSVLNA